MGISIKELNLTLNIGKTSGEGVVNDSMDSAKTATKDPCCEDDKAHDAVVNDAVKQVLQILKEQQER